MNHVTLSKYKVAWYAKCKYCGGRGVRMHYACQLMRLTGNDWTGPCFACRFDEFRSAIMSAFPNLVMHEVIEHYRQSRLS